MTLTDEDTNSIMDADEDFDDVADATIYPCACGHSKICDRRHNFKLE